MRFVLMYFFMVAHKAACQTLSKEVYEDMVEVLLVLEIFHIQDS